MCVQIALPALKVNKMSKKLVRDKIPDIIKKSGKKPVTRIANYDEYKKALREKFLEEAKEFYESGEKEEIADLLEVIYSILKSEGLSLKEIEGIRKKKAKKRGSFDKKIILEKVR